MVEFYARKKNKEGIGTAGALVIVCSWGGGRTPVMR